MESFNEKGEELKKILGNKSIEENREREAKEGKIEGLKRVRKGPRSKGMENKN